MPRGDLADHAANLRAVERRKRNDAMVRAHGPGRAEFRPRRRDDEQRRLRAALGQRPHEVERRRVGPVQVLEGEHGRLRPRSRQNPGRHRRELPSPQFLRREFRRARPRAAECRPAARSGARIRPGRGQPDVKCSRGRRDALRRSASAPPKRSLPHSASGCRGVFCRSCEEAHSTQVCGVSASLA